MHLQFWVLFFAFLLLVGGSPHKGENKKEKHRKSKNNHRFHFNHLAKEATHGIDQNSSTVNSSNTVDNATVSTIAYPQGAGNTDGGPVLFAGEPSPTSSTTQRVFLYNTSAPPVDDHVDARKGTLEIKEVKKVRKAKKALGLKKHENSGGVNNKKRNEKDKNKED